MNNIIFIYSKAFNNFIYNFFEELNNILLKMENFII